MSDGASPGTTPRADGAPLRVLLADDQELVRAGFAMVVGSQPDMVVVGEAANGEEAVALVASTPVDVVVMDVRMPVLDGIEATRRIVASGSSARVVVLTTYDLDQHVLDAIRAGASGFLLKDARPQQVLAALRTVHAGDAVIAPSTTRRLVDLMAELLPATPAPPASAQAPLAALTAREREVLVEMARGLSNAEIADRFVLSEGTVKTHVGRVLAKLGVRDRVQAVVLAYETGLVRPGRP